MRLFEQRLNSDIRPTADVIGSRGSGRRLHELDSLRGIAAMAVLVYHFTAVVPGVPRPAVVFPYGEYGVELFFIISGFVIFMTVRRTRSAMDFAVGRFARLYPPYLFCMLLTAAVTRGFHLDPFQAFGAQVLANLTMAPDLFPYGLVDGSYWTLLFEALFYVYAGCVFISLRVRNPEPICLAWLAVGAVIRTIGIDHLPFSITRFSLAEYCQLFTIGMMIYRLWSGEATRLTTVVLVIALSMSLFGPHWTLLPIDPLIYTAVICGFALAVWLAVIGALPFLNLPPLLFLGSISYTLYLLHQVLGMSLIRTLEARGVDPNVAVVMATIALIALATAVSRFVERPGQRAVKRMYARLVQRAKPAASPSGAA